MTFDHAQSPRLGQPTAVENPGVQLVTQATLPEIAYRGQIVYLLDIDTFRVFDGVAWQNPTAAGVGGTQTFVGSSAPAADAPGDLWMNTTTYQLSVWDGTAWKLSVDPQAAAAAQAASAAQAAAQNALGVAQGAQTTANSKITTFYTTVQPASPQYSPQAGDLWINTVTNKLYRFSSATAVNLVQDAGITQAINAAGTAQATADAKIQSWYQTTAPTGLTATDIGDLWFDTSNGNKPSRYNGTTWVAIQDAAISTAQTAANNAATAASTAQARADAAVLAANTAQTTANGKVTTFYTTTQPAAPTFTPQAGDLWINTTTNKLYRFNSPTAVDLIQDADITNAISAAGTAQATADSKITAWYTDTAPSNLTATDLGDLWFNTALDNQVSRWDGTQWNLLPLGGGALAPQAISGYHLSPTTQIPAGTTITTRALDANGVTTGQGVEYSDQGIFTYDANGNRIVEMPTDPTQPTIFRGDAEIDHLTVGTLTTLQETAIAQNAKVTLQSTIAAPTAKPAITVYNTTVQHTDDGNWANRHYLAYDGTYWYTIRIISTSAFDVERWTAAGKLYSKDSYNVPGDTLTPLGLCWNGTWLCVLYSWLVKKTSVKTVYMTKYTQGTWVVAGNSTVVSGTTAQMQLTGNGSALGWDATAGQFIWAQSRSDNSYKIRFQRFSGVTATGTTMTWNTALDTTWTYGNNLSTVMYGDYGFGTPSYVSYYFGGALPIHVTPADGSDDLVNQWGQNTVPNTVGLAYDGTNIWHMSQTGARIKYENGNNFNEVTWGQSPAYYASYSWTDGTNETQIGTPVRFVMKKRALIKIQAAVPPASVTAPKIYLAHGGTTLAPNIACMYYQSSGAGSPPSLVISNAVFTGEMNKPTSTWPIGTPAKVVSTSGATYLSADDAFAAPYKMRSGNVTLTDTNNNGTTVVSTTVDFTKGGLLPAFPSVPNVVCTNNTSQSGTTVTQIFVSSITTTGCTINMIKNTLTQSQIAWIAMISD